MRNTRHDYGRKNGHWWAFHGKVEWKPPKGDRPSPLVFVNEQPLTQAELLVAAAGFVLAERDHWQRWREGDPPLPRTTLLECLLELDAPRTTVELVMAWARNIDADWDTYEAVKAARIAAREIDDAG